MNMMETKELLQEISAIDKRQVTPETVAAWQGILTAIPFEIAKEAHKLARRDATINYLEPRHIVFWAKEAAYKLDRESKKQEDQVFQGTPEPLCRAHQKRVTHCGICTRRLYEMNHLHDAALLVWAKQNIF